MIGGQGFSLLWRWVWLSVQPSTISKTTQLLHAAAQQRHTRHLSPASTASTQATFLFIHLCWAMEVRIPFVPLHMCSVTRLLTANLLIASTILQFWVWIFAQCTSVPRSPNQTIIVVQNQVLPPLPNPNTPAIHPLTPSLPLHSRRLRRSSTFQPPSSSSSFCHLLLLSSSTSLHGVS